MGSFACPKCLSKLHKGEDKCRVCGYSGDLGNWKYMSSDDYVGPLEMKGATSQKPQFSKMKYSPDGDVVQ